MYKGGEGTFKLGCSEANSRHCPRRDVRQEVGGGSSARRCPRGP